MLRLIKNEKRLFTRFGSNHLEGQLLLGSGKEIRARIFDMGPGGVGFEVPETFDPTQERDLELKIHHQGRQLYQGQAVLRDVYSLEGGLRAGLSVTTHPRLFDELEFFTASREFDLLTKDEDLAEVIKDLMMNSGQIQATLEHSSGRTNARFVHDSMLKEISHLKFCMEGKSEFSARAGEKILVSLSSYGTFYAFYSHLISSTNEAVHLKIPQTICRLYRRSLKRLSNHDGLYKARIQSREWKIESGEFQVLDFHEKGIRISAPFHCALPPVGSLLESVEILEERKAITRVAARIASAIPMGREIHLGIELFHRVTPGVSDLAHIVHARRYPKIEDAHDQDFERFWDLFERSGYVHVREGGVIEAFKRDAKVVWGKLMKSKYELARNFGVVTDGMFTGGAHLTHFYPDTWLFHHLAIHPGKQRTDMPQIYCAVTDFLASRRAKYVLGYFDANETWAQKTYMDFIQQYPYPEDNHVEIFEVFQLRPNDAPEPIELPDGYEIREARKWDLKRIGRYFEIKYSEMMRDAFGVLHESDLTMPSFSEKFANLDVLRTRTFFVVTRGTELIAFAMVDTTSSGLNVYALGDSFKIFAWNEKDFTDEVHRALVLQVAKHFKSLGKSESLYLSTIPPKWEDHKKYMAWVVKGVLWIAKACIFSRYKSYIERFFGRVESRRAKVRMRNREEENRLA